ncbi:MAG: hypothetical protein PVH19_06180 [Planctomycetia bacterium]|jgi:hypothetical protein
MNQLISTMTLLFADISQLGGGPFWGKVCFLGAYVLLLIWLIFMPAKLINEEPGTPIWKRARLWAILIAVIQIGVYAVLG